MRIVLLLLTLAAAPLHAQLKDEQIVEMHADGKTVKDRYTKENGKITGKREKFYEDGTLEFTGQYWNDNLTGACAEYYPSEDPNKEKKRPKSTGTFVDGYLSGRVTLYYSNGVIERQGNVQGSYRNSFDGGKPSDGAWIQNWESGLPRFTCNFKGGRLFGDAVVYGERKPWRKITFAEGGLRGTVTVYAKGNPVLQGDEEFSADQWWLDALCYGGIKQGRWQKFFPEGGTAFDCTYVDGLIDGVATEFYAPKKPRQSGSFLDGKLNGTYWRFHDNGEVQESGAVSSSWVNSFERQVRQGRWEWYTQTGILSLEATYNDSLFEGDATSFYENHNPRVKGTFSGGKLTGTLTRYYEDKVVMESGGVSSSFGLNVLINEIRHGRWVFKYPNDVVKFEGTYADNDLEGAATSYYQNREKQCEGTFKKGRLTGTLTRYHDNKEIKETGEVSGNNWQNTFELEVREGAWVCRHSNGNKSFTGTYVKNLLQGEAISYFETENKRVQGTFNNGRLTGILTRYFDEEQKVEEQQVRETGEVSTNLWENMFDLPVRQGLWNIYHPNGNPHFELTYKDNQLEGKATRFHANGKPESVGTFKDGKLNGLVTRYYDNEELRETGQVSSSQDGSFQSMVREGAWVHYHDNGEKEAEGSYEKGEKTGTWIYYDREGKPLK
jgi:uncharacterized protein